MINIRYFASLREQFGCDNEQLPWQAEFSDISAVKSHLAERGESWQKTLMNPTVLAAVNQQMTSPETVIKDGDEIAFFPPVTGG